MRSIRAHVCGAVLLTFAGASSAQRQQTAPATPTFRVTSNLVFLDVTVLDKKGHPVVTGLTKDDFTITESERPQCIFSFDAPSTGAKTAENSPATILVLDLLNTPSADLAYARYSAGRYLAMQPKRLDSPTELMVLNNTSLDMVQAYTHRRDDLIYALEHVPRAVPYKLTGGKDWLDQRLSQSIQALQQIALQNRGLRGRKNILWLGYGGPGIPMDPADPRYDKSMRFYAHATTNMLVDARMTLFLINPTGVKGMQNPDYFRIGQRSVINAMESVQGDPFTGRINFGMLVHSTGGVFFSDRNDVDAAIREAQELGSNYYTMTYQPPAGLADGKYRQIEVTLRDSNLRAMTKTGYYAPEAATDSNPVAQRVDPMVEISEAAQSNVMFDSLGLTIARVTRHPDSNTAEITALLKSTNLRWQAMDDGRSAANITVAAVSLSKRRDILASRLQRLTIFSNSQDPARLAESNTFVTVTVPVPRHTDRVRVLIRAQDGGRVGTVDLDHKDLETAPENPSPEPKLKDRPQPVGITRQP
jgi:VWFA-related protein